MRDMEAGYAKVRADPNLLGGQSFSVTGYSLGGHLATAFNLLHRSDAQKVVTFNGAGGGKVNDGFAPAVQPALSTRLRNAFTGEVESHDENGWLVDFFDTGALARRIAAVQEDPAASRALRLRAAATVRSLNGMENGVRQYRALLGLDTAPVRLTSLH